MEHSEDRISALEERVARLQRRLDERERPADRPMDRRALLRGAVAGIVGAAAAPAVFGASPASAGTGDPLLIGVANNTTSTPNAVTGLTATNSDLPVFQLTNVAPLSAENGANPLLRLTPSAGFVDPAVGDVGDLMVTDLTSSTLSSQGGAYLNFAHTGATSGDSEVYWGNVYTSAFASFIEFLPNPFRVLDTRRPNNTGARMNAGQTIAINLGENFAPKPPNAREISPQGLVTFGLGAIVNLTAVSPLGGGFVTVWPSGPRPTASALNYSTGVTLANFSIVALGPTDSFLLFVSQATHVLVDVIGFVVPDVGLVGSQSASETAATRATRAQRMARPRRA